jgi:oligopeptide transport system ATP-binding protein
VSALLEARGLTVRYLLRGRGWRRPTPLRAVDDVSFEIESGGRLGVVGESGCGKSTLARAVLRLAPLAAGELHWRGRRYEALDAAALRPLRREMQLVFQDPIGSLDPCMTAGQSVEEALLALCGPLADAERRERLARIFEELGLDPGLRDRYPHELSGGQCQRVAIARATVGRPGLLICDEATSSLDVSVQAQIVNLLAQLQALHGMALLFISHNLALVRQLCSEVLVMYLGRVVERASVEALFDAPRHPYTHALLAAVPRLQPRQAPRVELRGEPASSPAPTSACAFAARCQHAIGVCTEQRPVLERAADGGWVACHRWREL